MFSNIIEGAGIDVAKCNQLLREDEMSDVSAELEGSTPNMWILILNKEMKTFSQL